MNNDNYGPVNYDEAEKMLCCPYCGSELEKTYSTCCGEAGHGVWVYFNEFGEEVDFSKEAI